jgi:hypothetical protein
MMGSLKQILAFLLYGSFVLSLPLAGHAGQGTATPAAATRDGKHDFDWEFGNWKTHVKRRLHPLSGPESWAEYDGTSVIRRIWDGKANMVELEVDGPQGHLELLSLRLYDPDNHSWSLNVASSLGGGLGVPTVGGFKDGRGEFYDDETFAGKPVKVRFVISDLKPGSAHFEQALSPDGGKTWVINWIADDTRIPDAAAMKSGGGSL